MSFWILNDALNSLKCIPTVITLELVASSHCRKQIQGSQAESEVLQSSARQSTKRVLKTDEQPYKGSVEE